MELKCECGSKNFDVFEPEQDYFTFLCVNCGFVPKGDSPLAMAILEQLAKEEGCSFSKNPEIEPEKSPIIGL